ncbi:hypothetical protein Ahy_B06g083564 [Arachis hypogaea]|uniref:Putative plant transposon protein domain-containing protein n=1 Tax=Arachis hypogaea TaxID=3818 RepID=A0A444YPZ1_ARAHY|nr:hypothetical protein Ahy_B06g083564 [Arachis hypogaea]
MSLIVNLHHLNLHLHIWNKPHKKYFFVLIQEQQEFRKKQEQVMSTLAKALGHSASLRSCHKQEIIVDECVGLSEKCGVKEELQNQEEDVKSQYEAQKEINDEWVKEFYASFLKRDAQTVFLRGVTLDTSDTALDALMDILHIPLARDAYTQIMKDVTMGKISLDVVLEKIGLPEARWEYSKGKQVVLLSIACTDLNPEVRIWQQIITDYILPSTHATHIRIRVAVLLWAILEGKGISVLPLIRESMCKVNQQQKFNIPFPSLITRLAALSGVERHPADQTSVYISKQPFLPYDNYDGPPQKKRKTTEPASTAAEPSAPPTAPAPTPRPQTPYELDPGPPPPDTPEPEAEEPAYMEPAAEAGQAVQTPEQRLEEPRAEEHRAEEPRLEEPDVGAELTV